MTLNNTENVFKIAKIVNDYTFIITGGKEEGVQVNEKFEILQDGEFEVLDPDTQAPIGSYTLKKGFIYAHTIYDHFSICRTKTYDEKRETGLMATISGSGSKIISVHEKLDVTSEDITGGLTPDPVKVGDIVKKVTPSKSK
ncbi:hypothetical protein [Enterococcus alishanensis]